MKPTKRPPDEAATKTVTTAKLFQYIRARGRTHATTVEIAQELSVAPRSVARHLAILRAEGRIRVKTHRHGFNRGSSRYIECV